MLKDLIATAETFVIPGRSRFQLEHFVIGQHDTPEMKYKQILIEAQDLAYKIRLAELDIEKKRIEIHRLLSSGDPIESIEAEEKRIGIVLTERTLAGARMELSWLEELAAEFGDYSWEDIEANQPDYWQKRLSRQAGLERMGNIEGISSGNLNSMLQIGMLEKESEVEGHAVRYLETQLD